MKDIPSYRSSVMLVAMFDCISYSNPFFTATCLNQDYAGQFDNSPVYFELAMMRATFWKENLMMMMVNAVIMND